MFIEQHPAVTEWMAAEAVRQNDILNIVRATLGGTAQELMVCLYYGLPLRDNELSKITQQLLKNTLSSHFLFGAQSDVLVAWKKSDELVQQLLEGAYANLQTRIAVFNSPATEGKEKLYPWSDVEWQRLLLLHGPTPPKFLRRSYEVDEIQELLGYTNPSTVYASLQTAEEKLTRAFDSPRYRTI